MRKNPSRRADLLVSLIKVAALTTQFGRAEVGVSLTKYCILEVWNWCLLPKVIQGVERIVGRFAGPHWNPSHVHGERSCDAALARVHAAHCGECTGLLPSEWLQPNAKDSSG